MEDSSSSSDSDSSSYVTITLKTKQARIVADFITMFRGIATVDRSRVTTQQQDIDIDDALVDLEQRLNVSLSPVTNKEG